MRRGPARDGGFSLFELVVVLVFFCVIVALLVERLDYYQQKAEQATVETTVQLIKTGLQIRLAELIIANREGEARALESENPTAWLETRPPNYAGNYPARPEAGNWYYDVSQRQLVYLPRTAAPVPEGGGKPLNELRFMVRLWRDPGPVTRSVRGIALVPVQPYRWP